MGDTSITNMQALPGSVFKDHNDAHLRIWIRLGSTGNFDLLSPDQAISSAPYSLGGNGSLNASASSGGSVSNGSGSSGYTVSNPQSIGSATVGAYARLVANGPSQPSATLVLLTGDSADIVTYYADQPGRLEYAFGAHTFPFPKAGESLADQKTLVGPASVRLVAPTGTKNVSILQVKRADGRDPTKLEGAPPPPADGQNPVTSPPSIVSVPSARTVARGGTTTLFVSASGENLTYQWKKNGQAIAGATSSALPLENATGADAGQYVVDVTNPNGSVSSQTITVTVKMPVVPAGVYRIDNSAGNLGHEVSLTSFSIDQHEVTKAFWDEVYTWAIANGYDFSNAGIAEGPEYPVHSINWYDSVKWANALSERDGHTPCYYTDNNCTQVYRTGEVDLTNYNVRWNVDGYRLPTESEWEVAARGGLEGSKYAWGESTSTSKANFDQSKDFMSGNDAAAVGLEALAAKYDAFVIVCSSYGDGDPPSNYGAFLAAVHLNRVAALARLAPREHLREPLLLNLTSLYELASAHGPQQRRRLERERRGSISRCPGRAPSNKARERRARRTTVHPWILLLPAQIMKNPTSTCQRPICVANCATYQVGGPFRRALRPVLSRDH